MSYKVPLQDINGKVTKAIQADSALNVSSSISDHVSAKSHAHGAHSATIYSDGDSVVSEDDVGGEIESGTFGSVLSASVASVRLTGGIIHIGPGTFSIATSRLVPYTLATSNSPIIIRGSGVSTILDMSAVNGAGLHFYGTSLAQSTTAANCEIGSSSIVVASASGLVAGDWIDIRSSLTIGANYRSERKKIISVDENTITLDSLLNDNYSNAAIQRYCMGGDLEISDLSIIGNPANVYGIGIKVQDFYNAKIHDVTIDGVGNYAGIMFHHVVDSAMYRNKYLNILGSGWGYGCVIFGASRNIDVFDNVAKNVYKLVTCTGGGTGTYGTSRFIRVHRNRAENTQWNAFDCHWEGEYIDFIDNTIINPYRIGIGLTVNHVRAIGNHIYSQDNPDAGSFDAIFVGGSHGPDCLDCQISRNTISRSPASISTESVGIRLYNDTDSQNIQAIIDENTIDGFVVGIQANVWDKYLKIRRNTITTPIGGHGIWINAQKADAGRLVVTDNDIYGSDILIEGYAIESIVSGNWEDS